MQLNNILIRILCSIKKINTNTAAINIPIKILAEILLFLLSSQKSGILKIIQRLLSLLNFLVNF